MRLPPSLLLVTLLLGRAAAADATPAPSVRLRYIVDPGLGCPEEQKLRDLVSERLGYDPFNDQAERSVAATITRERRALSARVELLDGSGHVTGSRTIPGRGKDCLELASAVALAISIAIDPQRFARVVTPPPVSPSSCPPAPECAPPVTCPTPTVCAPPPPAPVCPPAPLCPPPPPPPPTSRWHLRVAGGAVGALGSAPGAALGFEVEGGARHDRYSLSLDARVDLPASASGQTRGAETSLALGALVPCVHALGVLQLCALAALGEVRATGFGIAHPRSTVGAVGWFGARAAVELGLAAGFGLRAHVDVLVPVNPVVVTIDGVQTWSAPVLSAVVGLGVVQTF